MPFSFGDFNPFQVINTADSEANLLLKLNYCQKTRYNNSKRRGFYLLDIQRYPDSFKLMMAGATRNVYEINVDEVAKTIRCNCPDALGHCQTHNTICKHSYFVLFKMLKMWDLGLPQNNFFQDNEFSQTDMETVSGKLMTIYNMFTDSHEDTYVVPIYTNKFKRFQEAQHAIANQDTTMEIENKFECLGLEEGEDKACPICYSDFEAGDKLVKCPCCHNKFHEGCMQRWLETGRSNCVFCRSEVWQEYRDLNMGNIYDCARYPNLNLMT
jgi:hypothetical protein